MQGKQAKMVRPTQERAMLGSLATTHSPARDRVMFLFSMKAGLRAKAMAALTWAMVTDAQGHVAEVLHGEARPPPWPSPTVAVSPTAPAPERFTSGDDGARDGPHAAALHSRLRRGRRARVPAARQWRRARLSHPASRRSQSRAGGRSPDRS